MAGQLADAISNTIEYLSQNIAVLILNGVLGITMEFFKFFILLLIVLAAAYLIIIYPYNGETSSSTEDESPAKEEMKEIVVNPIGAPLVDLPTTSDLRAEHQQVEKEHLLQSEPEQVASLNNAVDELEGMEIDKNIINDLSQFHTDKLENGNHLEGATETDVNDSGSSKQTEFFTLEEHTKVVVILQNESIPLDEANNLQNKELPDTGCLERISVPCLMSTSSVK